MYEWCVREWVILKRAFEERKISLIGSSSWVDFSWTNNLCCIKVKHEFEQITEKFYLFSREINKANFIQNKGKNKLPEISNIYFYWLLLFIITNFTTSIATFINIITV